MGLLFKSKQERKTEAYASGDKAGLEGNLLDDMCQRVSEDFSRSEESQTYDKGYHHGQEHRHDRDRSNDRNSDGGSFDIFGSSGIDGGSSDSDDSGDSDSGGGGSDDDCYITTACIRAQNLPDTCFELTVLRHFRDLLIETPKGRKAVQEYDCLAPEIVGAINELPEENSTQLWNSLYSEIKSAVSQIAAGDLNGAFQTYQDMTLRLKKEYLG